MSRDLPQVTIRPFDRSDFEGLISWVPTQQALTQWCAAFFQYPLDPMQLQRYLDSTAQPNARVMFSAHDLAGEPVGHIEISMIWPHLSCRLSRILVAPDRRGQGIGRAMVARAVAFAFDIYHVDRIDLGVAADNTLAIACYRQQGFVHVGSWPNAIPIGTGTIDVYWMTLTRASVPIILPAATGVPC
jgi:RimJ/RimL family protein N-acetyltransferase